MSLELPKKTPVIIISATIIFAALMLISTAVQGVASRKTDPQVHYDELAAALEAEGLMPPQDDDVVAMKFAGLATRLDQVQFRETVAARSAVISLGNLFTAASTGTVVSQLELDPRQFDEIRPGTLRNALRRFSQLPESKLVPGGGNNSASRNRVIEFHVQPTGQTYRMMPVFKSGKCTKLLIQR